MNRSSELQVWAQSENESSFPANTGLKLNMGFKLNCQKPLLNVCAGVLWIKLGM